ncbi:methyltransferase [Roseovarius salis]|uniref:class I SAM-dependent methyltransferase n=1 Tax=Roseovarius salis TaxID=3376063 RepID=UPI0037CAFA03
MGGSSRLGLAVGSGDVSLPEDGRIAVFGPRAGMDLSALPGGLCQVITGFKPDRDHFAGLGYDCVREPEGRYAASLVCVARVRALTQAMIAEAAAVTDGPVIVDGAKTDGVEAVLKACRKRAAVGPVLSKAHGKLFHFPAGPGFEDWARGAPREIEGGFVTLPGIFSADGVDPGSALLADHLPARLGARVADLGAGWGYLSHRALAREDIEELHVVEADFAALACARRNVLDGRARFHWEDATRWQPPAKLDTVITNPPFHTGRSPDPALGQAFIRAAARMLAPKGQLFLVANRHLPYESELTRQFADVGEMDGDTRFKLLHAARPAVRAG